MSGLAELAAQAMSNADGEEDMEKQIQEALACPCVGENPDYLLLHNFQFQCCRRHRFIPFPAVAADLREGPCGPTFVDAFSCYIRSSHEEKGMDCLDQFKVFQECLKKNPDHVEKIMSDAEEAVQENGTGLAEKTDSEQPSETVTTSGQSK